jgi:hypothetical protein
MKTEISHDEYERQAMAARKATSVAERHQIFGFARYVCACGYREAIGLGVGIGRHMAIPETIPCELCGDPAVRSKIEFFEEERPPDPWETYWRVPSRRETGEHIQSGNFDPVLDRTGRTP